MELLNYYLQLFYKFCDYPLKSTNRSYPKYLNGGRNSEIDKSFMHPRDTVFDTARRIRT